MPGAWLLAPLVRITDCHALFPSGLFIANRNNCRAVYPDGTPGFEGNFETIEYTVPGTTWNSPGYDHAHFSCVDGTVYYSGRDYFSYDWSWPA